MSSTMRYKSGFTLVEVLIVIVVISILAAISVIAVSGIQKRTREATMAATFSDVAKKLKMYKAEKGSYPQTTTPWTIVCLGAPESYVAENGFAATQCSYSLHNANSMNIDTAVINALSPYGQLPSMPWPKISETHSSTDINYYRGILYEVNTSGSTAWLWYYVQGDGQCPSGETDGYNWDVDHTQCYLVLR